jgi:hypothetical protein
MHIVLVYNLQQLFSSRGSFSIVLIYNLLQPIFSINFKMYSNAITNDKKDGVKILSDEYIAFSLSREGEK